MRKSDQFAVIEAPQRTFGHEIVPLAEVRSGQNIIKTGTRNECIVYGEMYGTDTDLVKALSGHEGKNQINSIPR